MTQPPQEGRIAEWARQGQLAFVVGCPRSGTTWLQALLAAHPQVWSGAESHFFTMIQTAEVDFLQPRGWGLPAYWSREEWLALVREVFLATISRLPTPPTGFRYFLEKSPAHALCLDLVTATFPDARVIHVIRDARSVVASLERVREHWAHARWWMPRGIDATARFWERFVGAARASASRLPHPEAYVEVRYEALRADPEAELERLLGWLGLDSDPDLVARCVAACALERAGPSGAYDLGSGTVRAPPKYFGTGSPSGAQARLSRLQRLRVERVVGELLRELGYPVGPDRLRPWELLRTSSRVRRVLGRPPF